MENSIMQRIPWKAEYSVVSFFWLIDVAKSASLPEKNTRQKMKIDSRSDRVTSAIKSWNAVVLIFAYAPYQFMIFPAWAIVRLEIGGQIYISLSVAV